MRALRIVVGILWYLVSQLAQVPFMVLGWLLGWVPCMLHAWKPCQSTVGPIADTDCWRWPINFIYGNPSSDGVSGQYAFVWAGGHQIQYTALFKVGTPAWVVAYFWCFWRNAVDAMKYWFRWPKWKWAQPPAIWRGHYPFTLREFKFGWQIENGINVPVCDP